jgi:hypothetical protein
LATASSDGHSAYRFDPFVAIENAEAEANLVVLAALAARRR